ncbi:MAG: hypothetical protein M1840_007636 [Geoglossum simile]|nr:MAG: hypothetical protein M1840_007636 [Geoglossum simile]
MATASDDRYAFLPHFNTVFSIDDPGETADVLRAIHLHRPFLNYHPLVSIECSIITSAATVEQIFKPVRPGGRTSTGVRLNHILRPYLAPYATDLDGVPSDDTESVIIPTAKKLDRVDTYGWQVGVQFF